VPSKTSVGVTCFAVLPAVRPPITTILFPTTAAAPAARPWCSADHRPRQSGPGSGSVEGQHAPIGSPAPSRSCAPPSRDDPVKRNRFITLADGEKLVKREREAKCTGVGLAGLPPQARVHRRPAEHRVCRAAAKPCPRASSPSCGTGPRYQPACRPTSRPQQEKAISQISPNTTTSAVAGNVRHVLQRDVGDGGGRAMRARLSGL
jgi:hypothetical protein